MGLGSEAAKPSGLDGRAYPKQSPGLAARLGTECRPLVHTTTNSMYPQSGDAASTLTYTKTGVHEPPLTLVACFAQTHAVSANVKMSWVNHVLIEAHGR